MKYLQQMKGWLADTLFEDLVETPAMEKLIAARVKQAIGPAWFGMDATLAGFRRLSGAGQAQAALRDLPLPTQERMQDLAYYLYLTNPMARWRVELMSSYLLGGGVTLSAEDQRTQAVIEAFWSDPVNKWKKKLEPKVRELSLYGEQCWPIFTAPGTGRLRLGYLDPCLIETVVLDPDNAEQPIGVVTKKWTNYGELPERRYRVALEIPDEELTPPARRLRDEFTDGECFYFAVNKVSNGSRGISDLLDKADWLDGYEQFMFQRLERSDLANRIIFDLTLTGFTQDEVSAFMTKFQLPKPGGVHGHNEKVTLDVKTPDLKAQDATMDARLFKHQCLAGFPEHWYGGGGDVNRATAAEMDEPTFKLLESRQQYVKAMLEECALAAVRAAKRAGALPQTADETLQALMPGMVKADMGKMADAYEKVSRANAGNVAQQILTRVEARKLVAITTKPLGVELEELDEAQLAAQFGEENLDDAAQDYRRPGSSRNDAARNDATQTRLRAL